MWKKLHAAELHSPLEIYLDINLLSPHEHQSGVDLLQADKAAVTDIVQEGDGLHILLDP